MTKNTIELAKQGNSQAIAALINRSLKTQGITAKASLKGECLRVMLESAQVPDKQTMAQFMSQSMIRLSPKSIKTVKIYGRQIGQEVPAWAQKLDLDSPAQSIPDVSDRPALDEDSTPTTLSKSVWHTARNSQPINKTTQLSLDTQVTGESAKETSQNAQEKLKAAGVPKRISQLLVSSLGLRIAFDSLFVIYSLVWATYNYIYDLLGVADATGLFANLLQRLVMMIDSWWNPLEFMSYWINLISIVILLVWLHRLHASLRKIFSNYPISPWGAIARFAIPIYSIWGIWNTFTTIAKRFKSQEGELACRGALLQRWIPWLYIALISSNVLNRLYWFVARRSSQEDFSPWFFLVRNSAYLFVGIIWLQIVQIISKSVSEKAILDRSLPLTISPNQKKKSDKGNNIYSEVSPKRLSLKAIIFGLIIDIFGSALISSIIGIVTVMHLIRNGTRSEQIEAVLYSSNSFCIATIAIGLLFTVLGGFLAAHNARAFQLKHAFITGTLVTLIGTASVFAQPQIPNWYGLTILILTIPAAVIGGYLQQRISFSRT